MFNKLFEYIKSNELKLTYINEKLDIINYNKIGKFNNNVIEIYAKKNLITVNGNNLTINRLFDNEVLIEGSIDNIMFGELND